MLVTEQVGVACCDEGAAGDSSHSSRGHSLLLALLLPALLLPLLLVLALHTRESSLRSMSWVEGSDNQNRNSSSTFFLESDVMGIASVVHAISLDYTQSKASF